MKNEVARLRKERKISQDALAVAMGVSRQTICSIENGKYNPSIILAIHIARYFGKTVEDVFVADDITGWKSAEALLAAKKHNANYEENQKIDLPAEAIAGQAAFSLQGFRYGQFPLTSNGSEAIALYNYGIFTEKPRSLAEILYELEENELILLDGFAGTDPKSLGQYFSVIIFLIGCIRAMTPLISISEENAAFFSIPILMTRCRRCVPFRVYMMNWESLFIMKPMRRFCRKNIKP